MEVVYPHCAGLDVHKDTVVACVRHMQDGKVKTEVRTFSTMTGPLLELSSWLAQHCVTHIGMEATGVYWKPVWHILCDGDFQLVLANAAHVKNVPGRKTGVPSDRRVPASGWSLGWKTNVNDAQWLADLMAHGLIRGSFVPDEPTQQMRDLLRTRKQMVRKRSSHIERIQKTLHPTDHPEGTRPSAGTPGWKMPTSSWIRS
jgi:transposase